MPAAEACGPQDLTDAIVGFVSRKSRLDGAAVRGIIDRVIADAGADAVERLQRRLADRCDAWTYYPRDPLAQRLHHQLAPVVVTDAPEVKGSAHLDAVHGRPAIIVANHLSYSDANVVEVLLHQCGHADLAGRLTVIAGPKIYSDVGRRFSSLCFGTIKSPQNESVASGQAAMSARVVAAAARQTLATAHQRLCAGDALLIFPEGTRSRSGRMQSFLPGVARYFQGGDVMVVPIGLCGTEHMFGIGEERLGSARITMTVGRPFDIASARSRAGDSRRAFVDLLGLSVANTLPTPYRGVYGA